MGVYSRPRDAKRWPCFWRSRHMAGTFVGAFGVLALVLAGVGIYGVVAYSTRQPTHEIGIRVTLGAKPGDVLRLVLGQGMHITLIGLVIGVVASLGLARLMTSLLFGVNASDPLTFSAVVLLLGFIALVAVCLPARRAMRVDPMVALRHE
jgi:putative ABC transport system permease protein